jgi:hypothetical protein
VVPSTLYIYITHAEVPQLDFSFWMLTSIVEARRMASSGMLRRVALIRTGVSEEFSASLVG